LKTQSRRFTVTKAQQPTQSILTHHRQIDIGYRCHRLNQPIPQALMVAFLMIMGKIRS
jgi:hypothetical protein